MYFVCLNISRIWKVLTVRYIYTYSCWFFSDDWRRTFAAPESPSFCYLSHRVPRHLAVLQEGRGVVLDSWRGLKLNFTLCCFMSCIYCYLVNSSFIGRSGQGSSRLGHAKQRWEALYFAHSRLFCRLGRHCQWELGTEICFNCVLWNCTYVCI